MFVPLLTRRLNATLKRRQKGGGGGSSGGGGGGGGKSGGSTGGSSSGGGGKSGGSSGGGSSSGGSGTSSGGGKSEGGSSGGSSSSGSSGRSGPISSGPSGGSKAPTASPKSAGGGLPSTISQGLPFSGRSSGGGTRDQVFGTRKFGSGYPGLGSAGVAGRGFPFVFWPIAWAGAGAATYHYLDNSTEYGPYDNSSRPGGALMTAAFTSSSLPTTFRILADNFTVSSLIVDIQESCNSKFSTSPSVVPTAYNDSSSAPKPEQAIQYYRASTVSLTLDGYNNTAVFDNSADVPLPSNIDVELLSCLNSTIGSNAPLVDSDGSAASSTTGSMPTSRPTMVINSGVTSTVPQSAVLALFSVILFCLSNAF